MSCITLSQIDIPWDNWLAWLRETARQNILTARRSALLRLVWQESFLTREGLISRVEDLVGRGCFGSSPRTAFARDLAVVRQVLAQAGHRLTYSRGDGREGYYVEGRPVLDERLQRQIAGAVAEVDPRQAEISRRLSPAQQFQQGRSMTELAERVAAYRLRLRYPDLTEARARRVVRERRG